MQDKSTILHHKPTAPLCRYLDINEGNWKHFKEIHFRAAGSSEHIFSYKNSQATSSELITKELLYSFSASYSRVLPAEILESDSKELKLSLSSNTKQESYQFFVIFKNLDKRKAREADMYHILSFEIPKGEEVDPINGYIRRKISKANFLLHYSDNGLKYQISQRVKVLTYKSMKQSLIFLAHLLEVPSNIEHRSTLETLYAMYEKSEQQFKIKNFTYDPLFFEEIKSIVYRQLASFGLFPSYLEVNTMNEPSIVLWLKKIFSSPVYAPWGYSHHASIIVGNHRYSFINDPSSVHFQNKVNITQDLHRNYWSGSAKKRYFRMKFMDFFPMDSWIEDIAEFIKELLPNFKVLEDDERTRKYGIWKSLSLNLDMYIEKKKFPEKIAAEFVERYKDFFHKPGNLFKTAKANPLSKSIPKASQSRAEDPKEVFLKFTDLISRAEINGYHSLVNNCQTIITEAFDLFYSYFHEIQEPLLTDKVSETRNLREHFSKFQSLFNEQLKIRVDNFPLIHKIPNFNIYTDRDTSEMFKDKGFEKFREHAQGYLEKEKVQSFIGEILRSGSEIKKVAGKIESFSQSLQESRRKTMTESKLTTPMQVKQSLQEALSPKLNLQENELEKFSFISHLVCIFSNELFKVRKLIDTKKEEIEKLAKNSKALKNPKVFNSNLKSLEESLRNLYQEKYKHLRCYQECCFYYYNSVRIGIIPKLNDPISWFGFLIIRDPTKKKMENQQLEAEESKEDH